MLSTQDRVNGDYSLAIEIRQFEIEVGEGRAEAVVTLFAKLVHESRSRVIATREFTARSPASKGDPAHGIIASQANFDQVAKELIGWLTSSHGGRSSA